MLIRNGIRSNLRARGRTALFAGLIWALTLTLVLALGVELYCAGAVAECDRIYRSIALVEYMGAEYPDTDEPDDFARAAAAAIDDGALRAVSGVKSWSRDGRSLSCVEGYTRYSGVMPFQNRAVIVVSHITPVYASILEAIPADEAQNIEDDDSLVIGWGPDGGDVYYREVRSDEISYYTAIIGPVFYSYEGKSDVAVSVLPGAFELESGKAYVLHGSFLEDRIDTPGNGIRTFEVQPFPDDSDAQPWAEYRSTAPIDDLFLQYADRYRLINNYVETTVCPNVEDLYAFHQGQLYLSEGRFPQAADECIVSADMARLPGISLQDTLTVTALDASAENRYDVTLTDRQETLRVVGLVSATEGLSGCLWRLGNVDSDAALFGYLIGTAALENGEAASAVAAMEAMLPENVRVTLLDQGYADAVEPFETLERTATHVLLVCALGVAAVLVLFAFLFVGRQSAAVKIMVSLGTPRRGITAWLLSGAVVIAAGAALLGALPGMLCLPALFRAIQTAAARQSGVHLRYSETVLGAAKEADLSVSVPVWPLLLVIAAVVLAAAGLCLLFLRTAYRGGTLRRGKTRVHVPRGRTSVAGRGSMRFAALSIRRGGLRSLVVPVVSAALTVTVIFLAGVYQGWQSELQDTLDGTKLEGQVTSSSGRLFSGLVIPIDTARQLLELDDVDEMYVSARQPYYLPDEMPTFGESTFGQERRAAWIARQPDVVAVNALKGAKEFYFTDPVVEWLDGWDESCLAASYRAETGQASYDADATPEVWPAVVSDRFLSDHGLAMGDTLSVITDYLPLHLRVVGVYKQSGNRPHIYVPLAEYVDPDYLFGDAFPEAPQGAEWWWSSQEYQDYLIRNTTFSTCRFTLTSARHLDDTRRALYEAGFSWPEHLRSVRTTLLLRDASFIKLTENLGRYLSMGRLMMGIIFVIVALLGFIISWLMIHGRKQEFAVMRGFGAGRGRVFRSFFLEQAALSVTGCLAGCLSLLWLRSGGAMQWIALGGYLVCYLAGCAISVLLVGKTNLMELLAARE